MRLPGYTSGGVQSIRRRCTDSSVEVSGSDTEWLPSLNLVLMARSQTGKQTALALARAMARAPLADELRSSQNLNVSVLRDPRNRSDVGSAGNPSLKPMLADQLDLAYQWYFDKGSLLSAGVFYKKLSSYIKIDNYSTTIGGQNAMITESVNDSGGDAQEFRAIPTDPAGRRHLSTDLGIFSNYAYTTSNITRAFSRRCGIPG